MKTLKITVLVMALAMTGVPAFGQRAMGPPPDDQRDEGEFAPDQGPGGPPPSEERREEIRKKIETVRVWRMTEALKLDPNTSARLSSLLSPIEQKRHAIQREQVQSIRSLHQMLRAPKPDEARIKPVLDRLENNHRTMQDLKSEEIKGVRNILSIEQQARFVIFQLQFEREMREMIMNTRRGGQGGFGTGRGAPGGPMPGPGR